jgi:hypothetical protein
MISIADENSISESKKYWQEKTRENIENKRSDMILFSEQMVKACRIAQIVLADADLLGALEAKLTTLRRLHDDLKSAKELREKFPDVGFALDPVITKLEVEADFTEFRIQKMLDI